jgi:hypothetical protein
LAAFYGFQRQTNFQSCPQQSIGHGGNDCAAIGCNVLGLAGLLKNDGESTLLGVNLQRDFPAPGAPSRKDVQRRRIVWFVFRDVSAKMRVATDRPARP